MAKNGQTSWRWQRIPESGEAPVTGKCCVRHNRNGEKNGDANQAKKGVSAVTEGWPAEVHPVRRSDAVYGAEAGLPSGRAGHDAWATGATAGIQLRAAEGKLRPFFEEWSKKSSQI